MRWSHNGGTSCWSRVEAFSLNSFMQSVQYLHIISLDGILALSEQTRFHNFSSIFAGSVYSQMTAFFCTFHCSLISFEPFMPLSDTRFPHISCAVCFWEHCTCFICTLLIPYKLQCWYLALYSNCSFCDDRNEHTPLAFAVALIYSRTLDCEHNPF